MSMSLALFHEGTWYKTSFEGFTWDWDREVNVVWLCDTGFAT